MIDRILAGALRLRPLLVGCLLLALVALGVSALQPDSSGTSVLVVTRAIQAGGAITSDDFSEETVPETAVRADALTDVAEEGLYAAEDLLPGTILTEAVAAGTPESRAIPEGSVAIALDLGASQAELVGEGDSVDILAAGDDCEQAPCRATLLASDVLIVSLVVDDGSAWEASSTAHVHVIVNRDSAALVVGAARTGELSLALRSPGDGGDVESGTAAAENPPAQQQESTS